MTTYDTGFKLLKGHPLFWMEGVIEKELGFISEAHDIEHDKMMQHFGITFRNIAPLNGPLVDNEYTPSREFHVLLHLRYWKDNKIHNNYVVRAQECGYNLDEIPLPELRIE